MGYYKSLPKTWFNTERWSNTIPNRPLIYDCHYHELLSYMMCTLWHFYKLINYQNLCYHWLLESTNLCKSLAYFLFNLIAISQMCVYYCHRTSDPQKGYWSPPTNGDWVKFLSRKNGFGLPWIDLATLQVLVREGGGDIYCAT